MSFASMSATSGTAAGAPARPASRPALRPAPSPLIGGLVASAGLIGLLGLAPGAWAAPWFGGSRVAAPVPLGESYEYDDRAPYRSAYGNELPPRNTPLTSAASAVSRCNVGRLVGGLVGGGIGYAASRQDGRTWAVPLGALLGAQIGCNAAAGGAPLPW